MPGIGALARANLGERGAWRPSGAPPAPRFCPAAGLLAEEPRLQDFGIVEHQQVAGFEQAGQIGEMTIGERGRRAAVVHLEQAARAALRERRLIRAADARGVPVVGDGDALDSASATG